MQDKEFRQSQERKWDKLAQACQVAAWWHKQSLIAEDM